MELRPYQKRACAAIDAAVDGGARRVLLLAPCRSGKTIMAARQVAAELERGGRAMVVAHRKGLIAQAAAKLRTWGLLAPEMVVGGRTKVDTEARLFVASIQTLQARSWYPAVDYLVIDEAHRAMAEGYTRLVAAQQGVVLGLTATPERLDGRPLRGMFERLVPAATPQELIAEGHLLEPDCYAAPLQPDLEGVSVRGGDYREDELAEAMSRKELVGNIVTEWQRLAGGRPTLAYAVTVAHSLMIQERFRAAGITCEHVDGETPDALRDAILDRLRSGVTKVVTSVGVFTEGTDLPEVSVAIVARPTLSVALWVQIACRPLTPLEGKPRPIIIDHAGNSQRLGLPTDEREWTLDGRKKRDPAAVPSVATCPKCMALFRSGARVCPRCGAEIAAEAPRKPPKEREGRLALQATGTEKRERWKRMCSWAADNVAPGKNVAGTVAHRFKAVFGHWPPASWDAGEMVAELRAQRATKEAGR